MITYTLGDHDPGSTSSDLWKPGSKSFYLIMPLKVVGRQTLLAIRPNYSLVALILILLIVLEIM